MIEDPEDPSARVVFEEVVQRARKGELLVGVDRSFARRFYTTFPLRTIEEHTGEAPHLEKALVLGAFLGGPIALLASAVLAAIFIGWWSLIVIPAGFVLWFGYYSQSVLASARLTLISILLFAVGVLFVASSPAGRSLWGIALLYLGALWLGRFVYSGSTALLRNFVLRNRKAFEWLRGQLVLREVR